MYNNHFFFWVTILLPVCRTARCLHNNATPPALTSHQFCLCQPLLNCFPQHTCPVQHSVSMQALPYIAVPVASLPFVSWMLNTIAACKTATGAVKEIHGVGRRACSSGRTDCSAQRKNCRRQGQLRRGCGDWAVLCMSGEARNRERDGQEGWDRWGRKM